MDVNSRTGETWIEKKSSMSMAESGRDEYQMSLGEVENGTIGRRDGTDTLAFSSLGSDLQDTSRGSSIPGKENGLLGPLSKNQLLTSITNGWKNRVNGNHETVTVPWFYLSPTSLTGPLPFRYE
jgi:hypothetical protein